MERNIFLGPIIILGVFLFFGGFFSQVFAMSKSPQIPRLDLAKLKNTVSSTNVFVPLLDLKKLNLSSILQSEYDSKKIENKLYPVDEFVKACQECDILKLKHFFEKYSEDLSLLKDSRAFEVFWNVVEREAFSDWGKDDGARVKFVKEFLSEENKQAVNFLMSSLNVNDGMFRIVFLNLCFNKCYKMLKIVLSNSQIVNLLSRDLITSAIFLILKEKWKDGINLFREKIRGRTVLRNNMLKQ